MEYHPHEPAPELDLEEGDISQGGFVPLSKAAPQEDETDSDHDEDAQILAMIENAVMEMAAEGAFGDPEAAENEGDVDQEEQGPGFGDQLGESLKQGAIQYGGVNLLSLIAGGGTVGDMLNSLTNIDNIGNLAGGLGRMTLSQAVSMSIGESFDEIWDVDDESSAAEHVGHAYAKKGVNKIAAEIVSRVWGALTGEESESLKQKLDKFFGGAGLPAARLGDMHTCPMVSGTVPHVGGPVTAPGCPTVLVGGLPAARVGDKAMCVGPIDVIAMGMPKVLIGGQMAARMTDMTAHGGIITKGCPTVLIGPVGSGAAASGVSSPSKGGDGAGGGDGESENEQNPEEAGC